MKHKNLPINHFQDNSLAEIYQSISMKFAFITSPKNGSARCHTFVKCRDFLHDALRTQIAGTVTSIYSFRFNKKVNPPIDLRYMRMLVKNDAVKAVQTAKVAEWDAHILSGLALINHYEKMAGKPLSTAVRLINEPVATWLFTGPNFWLKTPYLASMYTFLIRLGVRRITFQTDEELQEKYKQIVDDIVNNDNDKKYLSSCWNKLSNVIIKRQELFGNGWDKIYNASIPTSNFHNNSGIVSLCKGITCDTELNKRVVECLK